MDSYLNNNLLVYHEIHSTYDIEYTLHHDDMESTRRYEG